MTLLKFAGACALMTVGMLSAQAQFIDLSFVGSWRTEIDIPGRPAGPINGLMLAHADGTGLYSDLTQVIPQQVGPKSTDIAYTTPSFGSWLRSRTGIRFTHVELLANPDSSLFGVCTTIFTLQQTGTDAYSGNATFSCVDANGVSAGPPATFPMKTKRISAGVP
jgi:hypothetical protein